MQRINVNRMRFINKSLHQNIAGAQQAAIGAFLEVNTQVQVPARVGQLVSDFIVPCIDPELMAAPTLDPL